MAVPVLKFWAIVTTRGVSLRLGLGLELLQEAFIALFGLANAVIDSFHGVGGVGSLAIALIGQPAPVLISLFVCFHWWRLGVKVWAIVTNRGVSFVPFLGIGVVGVALAGVPRLTLFGFLCQLNVLPGCLGFLFGKRLGGLGQVLGELENLFPALPRHPVAQFIVKVR